MTVYIESNFVLEQALEREQCESCEALVKIAGARAIRILIPAFSLAEPHIALMHQGNERSKFIPELRKHLSEMARSKSYQKDSPAFTEIVSLVIASEDRERAQLEAAVLRISSRRCASQRCRDHSPHVGNLRGGEGLSGKV
jgi:hypothetical protein